MTAAIGRPFGHQLVQRGGALRVHRLSNRYSQHRRHLPAGVSPPALFVLVNEEGTPRLQSCGASTSFGHNSGEPRFRGRTALCRPGETRTGLGQRDAWRVTAALRCARCPRSPGGDSWTTCGRSPRTGRFSSFCNVGLDWRFGGSADEWVCLRLPQSIRAMTATPTAAGNSSAGVIWWSGHDTAVTDESHPVDGLFSSDAVSRSDPRSPRAELSGVALSP
jgi:hypothetical protein